MHRSFYKAIGVLALILLGIGVVYVNSKPDVALEPTTTDIRYTDLDITFEQRSGAVVTTKNFLTNPRVKADVHNQGYFILNDPATAVPGSLANQKFTITYEKSTGFFNIVLLQKPFKVARTEAESYLVNLLEIDKVAMCDLSYTVSVPGYVDEAASGIDYHFSFCPGSVVLP